MAKRLLLLAALLAAGTAQADKTDISHATKDEATVVPRYEADGFTQPLKSLKFNPGLDQREFERASINALEVFDPGLEDQLMLMLGDEMLLLNQGPAGFIDEEAQGVVERFEEVLAPSAIARVPEPGQKDRARRGLVPRIHLAGHDDNKMPVPRTGPTLLGGRSGSGRDAGRRDDLGAAHAVKINRGWARSRP